MTKISPGRLKTRLGDLGFDLAWLKNGDSCGLVRRSRTPLLFEWIEPSWAGKRGEAVAAYVGVSILRCWNTKGLIELELLREVAARETCDTLINTTVEAEEWEERVVAIAPARCEELTARVGAQLLERTGPARSAADQYVARLPRIPSKGEAWKWLTRVASSREVEISDRIANWAGVRQVYSELTYEIAALLIAHFRSEIEPSLSLDNPLDNTELMFRLQILRERLGDRWPDEEPRYVADPPESV